MSSRRRAPFSTARRRTSRHRGAGPALGMPPTERKAAEHTTSTHTTATHTKSQGSGLGETREPDVVLRQPAQTTTRRHLKTTGRTALPLHGINRVVDENITTVCQAGARRSQETLPGAMLSAHWTGRHGLGVWWLGAARTVYRPLRANGPQTPWKERQKTTTNPLSPHLGQARPKHHLPSWVTGGTLSEFVHYRCD